MSNSISSNAVIIEDQMILDSMSPSVGRSGDAHVTYFLKRIIGTHICYTVLDCSKFIFILFGNIYMTFFLSSFLNFKISKV